jgi:predicted HicB family RNase H-like nuclease
MDVKTFDVTYPDGTRATFPESVATGLDRTMSDVKKDDRLELRIPAELKAKAMEAAEKDRRTLSQWVQLVIEEKLSALQRVEDQR